MPGRVPAVGAADWTELTVLVVGVGLSGAAAASTLARLGARVRAVDDGDGDRQQAAAASLRELGVDVVLGGLPHDVATAGGSVDLVVTSPGLRPKTPLLHDAATRGVPVWGEVELAHRLRPAGQRWYAVTGTNGKTTTTQMLGAMFETAGLRATTAGNIGTPLLEAVTAAGPDGRPAHEVLAVELSSFQLHYTSTLAVSAGAVLNLADDHLDWHGSMAAYAADKARVYTDGSVAVFNADDGRTRELAERSSAARRVGFRLGPPGPDELGLTGPDGQQVLTDRAFGAGPLLPVADLLVPGPHNVANALAAAALARAAGVPAAAVTRALSAFRPGGHRNQVVAVAGDVTYVNDSKATNPHAAAASLAAYPAVVWIAGGLNKGLAFDDLVRGAAGRLRAAVLIGTCADEVADALARHAPEVPVLRAAAMDDAVQHAAEVAVAGDTVLLAPAAASMDMFRDYAARGDAFAAAARRQEGER